MHNLVLIAALTLFSPDHPDITQACVAETAKVVTDYRHRQVITQHCLRRAHLSTRSGRYRSKIDGSLIHDRDRPRAWAMYDRALAANWLDPVGCESHRMVHRSAHHRAERRMAIEWPYKNHESPAVLREWITRSHDVERFGTRGPIDLNPSFHSRYLGKCVAPELFDRNDVSARVHALRALKVCKQTGVCTLEVLKERWGSPL